MRKIIWLRIVISLCLLQSSILYAQTPTAAQVDDSSYIVKPVGEEAYWALAQFLDYDKGQRLNVRIVEKIEEETYIREKIVFSGVRGDRVPGYLAFPTSGTGPYQVILCLHGLSGDKERWWQDDSFERGGLVTKGLLKKGYAVLSLDAQFHGERIANNDYGSPFNVLFSTQSTKFREMVFQTVIEYRMALDYLAMRTEVDTSRTGIIGLSMGGTMTFLLTAVEPRIKTAVACVTSPVGVTQFRNVKDIFRNVKDRTANRFSELATTPQFRELATTPQFRAMAVAPQNYAHAIGSRSFLMLMARNDDWYTEKEARQLFGLIPSPTKKLEFYDSGHQLPPEYVSKAIQWFEDRLK